MLSALLIAAALPVARHVDLPKLFSKQIDRAKERTTVPILLPQKLPSDFKRHYPAGKANAGGWRFDIGAVRDCHTATACFIAEFRGISQRQAERHADGAARARAHRLLPPERGAGRRARRRASSGASGARCSRSRPRSPGASRSCGWPTRRSATARASRRALDTAAPSSVDSLGRNDPGEGMWLAMAYDANGDAPSDGGVRRAVARQRLRRASRPGTSSAARCAR